MRVFYLLHKLESLFWTMHFFHAFLRLSLVCILILLSATLVAQTNFDPEKRPKTFVDLPKLAAAYKSIPFNSISIKDCRLDTSKIGYSGEKISHRIVTRLSFEKAVSQSVDSSLNGKLDKNSKYEVCFFIKHFWLDGMPEKRTRQTFCRAQIEIFLRADTNLYPIFRFDTSFVAMRQSMNIGDVIVSPFQSCLDKISGCSPDSVIKSKRQLNIKNVLSSYQKAQDYAQFKQTSLQKGVYLSYQDFLYNKLSYPELRYEQTLYTDDLFVTENGRETMLKEFWGFCDGKKQFVRIGHNFFQLTRQGYTFELHGPSSIDLLRKKEKMPLRPIPMLVTFALTSEPDDLVVFKPMQLNMETGKPYGF